MVLDALFKRVPEMMDTPPIRNNYAFLFLKTYIRKTIEKWKFCVYNKIEVVLW